MTVAQADRASARVGAPAGVPVPPRPPLAWGTVGALAALTLALHLATNAFTPYGVHRDELLYLAMGRHFHLWRMDFPPLIALVGLAERALGGDSLVSLRLFPALAGTLLLVMAALIAREVGGGRFAQGAAALAVLCGALFQRSAGLYQPVVFDQLWWTLTLFALLRLCRSGRPGWWLAVGVFCGIGLLTKFSILFAGAALFGAILLTRHRRALATPWPWLALVLAAAIGSPSVVGQVRLGYPVLESMSNLKATQLDNVGYGDFLLGQVLMIGPAILLAVAGLVSLQVGKARAFRIVGWTALLAVLILLLLHGKPYYAGPVYPALLGAGAAALGGVRTRIAGPALRWGMVVLMVAPALVLLPLGFPILAPARMAAYTRATHLEIANQSNHGWRERLPQDYADMLGWPAQVAEVARVYRALPPEKQAKAVIWASNYGQAAAAELYGPRWRLPPVVSPAGTYWFYGAGARPGDVLIGVGETRSFLAKDYATVTAAGVVNDPWTVAEERNDTIFVAEGPRATLQARWPGLRGRQ